MVAVRGLVEGTYEVPSHLTGTGASSAVLNNGTGPASSPIPARNGTITARFICTIPTSALDGAGHAVPRSKALYGHGPLGSATEVYGSGSRDASATNTTFCATWWVGMAQEDIGAVIGALSDMSAFRTIPDRLQQPMVNFLFLGRLLKHPRACRPTPPSRTASAPSCSTSRTCRSSA